MGSRLAIPNRYAFSASFANGVSWGQARADSQSLEKRPSCGVTTCSRHLRDRRIACSYHSSRGKFPH